MNSIQLVASFSPFVDDFAADLLGFPKLFTCEGFLDFYFLLSFETNISSPFRSGKVQLFLCNILGFFPVVYHDRE